MNRMIEVIYQDDVLKPMNPIDGLKKNQKMWVIVCSSFGKAGLEELIGTLTPEEAENMQRDIDKEFSTIEGDW